MKKLVCLLITVLLLFSCAGAEQSFTLGAVECVLPDGFSRHTTEDVNGTTIHFFQYSDNGSKIAASLACFAYDLGGDYSALGDDYIFDTFSQAFGTLFNKSSRTSNGHLVAYAECTKNGSFSTFVFAVDGKTCVTFQLDFGDSDYRQLQNELAKQIYNSITMPAAEVSAAPEVSASSAGDLSDMSLAELIALREQITLAMFETDEWQEVEVPKGVYTIGEDIPAGKWTIRSVDGSRVTIYWGDKLDTSGVELAWSGDIYVYEYLYSPTYRSYEVGDATEVTYDMHDGEYFIVDDGIAVFTPYAGKPTLGFK